MDTFSCRFFLIWIIIDIHFTGDVASTKESRTASYARLKDTIMSRLSVVHKIPPNIEHDFKKQFPLSFQFLIVGVSRMEEINQIITVDAFVEIKWTQAELAWNSSEFGGLEWVYMDANNMWCPDIMVMIGHGSTFILNIPRDVQVYSNGTVVSNSLNCLSFYCYIDFERFPFDVQQCSIGFYVITDASLPLIEIMSITEHVLKPFINTQGEWSLGSVSSEIVHTAPDMSDFPRYTFKIKRQSTYYVITVIFPMVLTSLMIPLVFLIPANTGEKLSYLTSIFTSTAVYLNYISDVMPHNLSRMPFLAVLLIEVLAEGFLATLASLLIVNIFKKENKLSARKIYPKNGPNFKENNCSQTNTDGDQKLLSSAKKSWSQGINFQMITSHLLDIIFFSAFSLCQSVILIYMFGFADWL